MLRSMLIPAAMLVTTACTNGDTDGIPIAQVGTLGNRIEVRNTGRQTWTPTTAWRVQEDLRLGSAALDDPESESFGQIASIVTDSRDMIYVLDISSQAICVFHPTGEYSHSIGRRGTGPGELSGAWTIAVGPGDTLWVVDDGTARYSAFSPDGSFLGSYRRRVQGFYPAVAGAFLNDGRYVDWRVSFPDGRMGARTRFEPIRVAPGIAGPDSLPPLEYEWRMLRAAGIPQTYFTGSLVAAVDRNGSIWFAHSEVYRIYRRTLAGDTALAFSLPAQGSPLGDDERDHVRSELSHLPSLVAAILQELPDTRPIVRRIVPDDAGHVLVFADVAGHTLGTVVDVFEEGGTYLGRLILPSAVALSARFPPVVHVTPEHLFLVVTDELGVPSVSRLKILRGT
ncbi:MAG: 6-bladed beta-propeller [Gemmatimonadaceae bacterium]|nr:6-bladed beta-propeller [Gemmatimonadaceae bacterium]MCW5827320.1 6-bladed beta-propeller [Gemmatimonadaceae bacterium]